MTLRMSAFNQTCRYSSKAIRKLTWKLWHDSAATAAFLMGDRFQAVIDSFGRPRVDDLPPMRPPAERQ